MGVRVSVDDRRLLKFLNNLSEKAQPRAFKSIARHAAKPIVAESRRLISQKVMNKGQGTGTLVRSIGIKSLKRSSGVYVAPNYKEGGTDGRYAHNVMFKGTKTSPDNPMGNVLLDAARNVRSQVLDSMYKGIWKVLRREANKLK